MSAFRMRMCRATLSFLMVFVTAYSFAQKVHVEFDKNVDFSRFKTYTWLESKHPADTFWAQRVAKAIDKQLTKKGLKRVEGSPIYDLDVVYNSGVNERTIIKDYDYGLLPYLYLAYVYGRYGPIWLYWPPDLDSTEIKKNATLVVDLVDASSNNMIWHGVASNTLSDNTKKNERRLSKAIKKMFKEYPPKKSRRHKGK